MSRITERDERTPLPSREKLCLLRVSAVLEIELGIFAVTLRSAPSLSKHFCFVLTESYPYQACLNSHFPQAGLELEIFSPLSLEQLGLQATSTGPALLILVKDYVFKKIIS